MKQVYYEINKKEISKLVSSLKAKINTLEFLPECNEIEILLPDNKKIYIYIVKNKVYFVKEPFVYITSEEFLNITLSPIRDIILYNIDLFANPIYIR